MDVMTCEMVVSSQDTFVPRNFEQFLRRIATAPRKLHTVCCTACSRPLYSKPLTKKYQDHLVNHNPMKVSSVGAPLATCSQNVSSHNGIDLTVAYLKVVKYKQGLLQRPCSALCESIPEPAHRRLSEWLPERPFVRKSCWAKSLSGKKSFNNKMHDLSQKIHQDNMMLLIRLRVA